VGVGVVMGWGGGVEGGGDVVKMIL